ncbi:unnamed protein product [Closterium sp. NIES-53]
MAMTPDGLLKFRKTGSTGGLAALGAAAGAIGAAAGAAGAAAGAAETAAGAAETAAGAAETTAGAAETAAGAAETAAGAVDEEATATAECSFPAVTTEGELTPSSPPLPFPSPPLCIVAIFTGSTLMLEPDFSFACSTVDSGERYTAWPSTMNQTCCF